MGNVINRTTYKYKQSVNTPDFPTTDWLINPDLSAVSGQPEKYWKVEGDTVVIMDAAEQQSVNKPTDLPPQNFMDDFIGEIPPRWIPQITGSASDVGIVSPGGDGGVVRLLADNKIGNKAALVTSKVQLSVQSLEYLIVRFREITNTFQTVELGLYVDAATFVFIKRTGNTNWTVSSSDNGVAAPPTDIGIPKDVDWHTASIRYSGGSLSFSFDGTIVASISSNIPTAQMELKMSVTTMVTDRAMSSREVYIDSVTVQTARA